jgi:hypothetical protein
MVRCLWGQLRVRAQRLLHAGKGAQMLMDASLDHSGWTPGALARLLDLSARLPFEEASQVAIGFGLKISSSELERLSHPYRQACRKEVKRCLQEQVQEELAPGGKGKIQVLQCDGVYALGRAANGSCEVIEIKSVVVYPQASPSQRTMLAEVMEASELLGLVDGLLRSAGICSKDTLVGLGDGAAWVENIFDSLGAVRITDVYHSAGYFDLVMQPLGWTEEARKRERKRWCKGEIAAREWLNKHLPKPELWLSWSEEALGALQYLEKRLDNMDYPAFKAKGYPIGSGQVEGMNKSVIGNRLKRSGMQWSREGAASMASLRAQSCSKHSLVDFDELRQQAYPVLAT